MGRNLEDTDVKFNSPDEWEIQAYEGDGLSFNTPAYKDTLSMKFDGKDYEEKGPDVAPGSMSSGKRVNAHTLEVTDKVKGEVMDHTKFEVSPDGKDVDVDGARKRPGRTPRLSSTTRCSSAGGPSFAPSVSSPLQRVGIPP